MTRKITPQPPPAAVQPLRVAIPEAARLLSISRSQVYKRISRGEIGTVKDGARTLVPMEELRRYASMNAASA